ncbi:orotidine-5'-phosphate decarboxylase [Cohaesibacter sp. ES.047]|uniref:orotidine-5'-phosphate decarboxylase n=1 Tax=Cohaesibacter sp. ES.047 TaxID=1798205 RepID=UPI000BB90297|nr:orotidine-5'-phosphate decarboxylase [Cohaesibacter sp. ES.047]SNY90484.1 orotidine-5'-phosphate decarboxylase [Cohaesibacter sp. ES.047]
MTSNLSIPAKDRLIVPLDVSSVEDAREIVMDLGDSVSFYKIGYQLAYAGGFELAKELIEAENNVFMDLKLLDIDNTIEKGVESIRALDAKFLTIHAYPSAMRAAVAGRGKSDLKLLGVTVLTSMDDEDLKEAGYSSKAEDLVAKRATAARQAGMDGIVCAAQEAAAMRKIVGPDMAIVTPGIRQEGTSADDQKRVMTPGRAISEGSDYLVVGRPILGARKRSMTALSIIDEIEAALASRS